MRASAGFRVPDSTVRNSEVFILGVAMRLSYPQGRIEADYLTKATFHISYASAGYDLVCIRLRRSF